MVALTSDLKAVVGQRQLLAGHILPQRCEANPNATLTGGPTLSMIAV